MPDYADTSFLISLYLSDSHSATAARIMASKPTIFLTPLGELELANALELAVFRSQIGAETVKQARAALRQDVADGVYSLQAMPATVYERAAGIAQKRSARFGTRTLDILHVASALILGAHAFFSFDDRQRKLAHAEGLRSPSL